METLHTFYISPFFGSLLVQADKIGWEEKEDKKAICVVLRTLPYLR